MKIDYLYQNKKRKQIANSLTALTTAYLEPDNKYLLSE